MFDWILNTPLIYISFTRISLYEETSFVRNLKLIQKNLSGNSRSSLDFVWAWSYLTDLLKNGGCNLLKKLQNSRGSSVIISSCLCGYFVCPKFFLVGISCVQNFILWVFCGSKFFSYGHFVGPIFFSRLNSWFKNLQLLVVWERVTENRNA